MALINCPQCGAQVSDKAEKCPSCGFVLIEKEPILCKECGTELQNGDTICPKCGCPVENDKDKNETVKANTSSLNKKKLKTIIIAAVVVIAITITGIFINKSNAKSEWEKNYQSAVSTMLDGAATAETTGNGIYSVWRNTIYHKFDPDTNEYTLTETGKFLYSNKSGDATSSQRDLFNDDFNTSLSLYFSDTAYKSASSSLNSNQSSVNKLMKKLQTVPDGYENAYSAIEDFYDNYTEFVNLILSPSGSLQTFSSSFSSLDSSVLSAYQKSKNYADGFNNE